MRDGNLVFAQDSGQVVDTVVMGSEPVHLCLQGEKVLAVSSNSYQLHISSGVLSSTQIALRSVRQICSLPEGFAAVTSDLSLGVIAATLDYHMSFEVVRFFPQTIKRLCNIGPFVLALVDEVPAKVAVLETSFWEETERVELVPRAQYFALGPGPQEDLFYVAGELEGKGILHLCKMFPAALATTEKFLCPVRAVALAKESFLVVGAGPHLFLMKANADLSLESVACIRVSSNVTVTQIVDLHAVDDYLLVTQSTFGLLLYAIKDNAFELVGRARLKNQTLFSGVLWGDVVVCFSKEGELIVLERGPRMALVSVTQLAKMNMWEGGRKLLVDGQRVLVLTLSGSVFSLSKDESGLRLEQQRSALENCPAYLRKDFSDFRQPLNIVFVTQTDLDLLKKCTGDSK